MYDSILFNSILYELVTIEFCKFTANWEDVNIEFPKFTANWEDVNADTPTILLFVKM